MFQSCVPKLCSKAMLDVEEDLYRSTNECTTEQTILNDADRNICNC